MKSALIVVAVAIAGTASEAQTTLRVITYNIHHAEGTDKALDLDRIAAVIKAERPDVVCLQEVDRNLPRTRNLDFPAILSEKLGMQGVFEPNYRFDGGEYGNMILTRMRIESHENIPLPNPKEQEPRGMLRVTIQVNGRLVDVLNTHLGLDAEERLAQASEIVTRLEDFPAILAGDMNETRMGPALQILLQKMKDTGSLQASSNRRRIDFVLASRHFIPIKSQIVKTPVTEVASDHLPVVADVRLEPERTVEKRGEYETEDPRVHEVLGGNR